MESQDIINHLRDQEFEEGELLALINQLVREKMEFAANRAVRQFNEARQKFRDKRDERLKQEFRDYVLSEINELRSYTKNLRAQAMYKENRKKKKKYGQKHNPQLPH